MIIKTTVAQAMTASLATRDNGSIVISDDYKIVTVLNRSQFIGCLVVERQRHIDAQHISPQDALFASRQIKSIDILLNKAEALIK